MYCVLIPFNRIFPLYTHLRILLALLTAVFFMYRFWPVQHHVRINIILCVISHRPSARFECVNCCRLRHRCAVQYYIFIIFSKGRTMRAYASYTCTLNVHFLFDRIPLLHLAPYAPRTVCSSLTVRVLPPLRFNLANCRCVAHANRVCPTCNAIQWWPVHCGGALRFVRGSLIDLFSYTHGLLDERKTFWQAEHAQNPRM